MGRVGHLYPLGSDSTALVGQPPRILLLAGDRIVQTLDPVYPRLGMGGTGEPPWGVDRSGRVLGVEGFAFQPRSGWSRTHADSLLVMLSTGSVFDEGTSEPDTIGRVGGQGRWGVEHVSTVAQMGGREVTMNSTLTSPLASEGQAMALPGRLGRAGAPGPLPRGLADPGRGNGSGAPRCP